jgi:predicted amidophosphoribosyltransferase
MTCAEPECSVCNRKFDLVDLVCPNCKKQTKVADATVTFDPNQSYRIRYEQEG